MDTRLRIVAQADHTDALYSLIEQNADTLEGFDETPFVETPLHVAAAAGNIKFAMQMINLKPSFARKLNQSLYSPMHLAVKNGQTLMALWLMKTDKDLVRVKGRDGKTPFHFAVEEENLDILSEFLTNCPECIKDVTIKGQNALHLAVQTNKFKAVKMLVRWFEWHRDAIKWRYEFLNGGDRKGNTALHMAARKNLLQAVLLLSKDKDVEKNIKNLYGKTALDILIDENQSSSSQVDNIGTQKFLRRAGGLTASSLDNEKLLSKRLRSEMPGYLGLWRSVLQWRKGITDEKSNAMLVVAALIMTIAFQGVLSPPGGILRASVDSSNNTTPACNRNCNNYSPQESPGKSIMPKDTFILYWVSNTFALIVAFMITVYLLPPGPMAAMFMIMLLGLLCSYHVSLSVISPSLALPNWSFAMFYAFYLLLGLYSLAAYGKTRLRLRIFGKLGKNFAIRVASSST